MFTVFGKCAIGADFSSWKWIAFIFTWLVTVAYRLLDFDFCAMQYVDLRWTLQFIWQLRCIAENWTWLTSCQQYSRRRFIHAIFKHLDVGLEYVNIPQKAFMQMNFAVEQCYSIWRKKYFYVRFIICHTPTTDVFTRRGDQYKPVVS